MGAHGRGRSRRGHQLKDMTDSELHEAIDSAMKAVVERFKRKREAEQAEAASRMPSPPREQPEQ